VNCRQASRTAESMALFRALESARAEGSRLFADPFAAYFLSLSMRCAVGLAARYPFVHAGLTRFIDQRWPGARPSGVARTVLIDQAFREALASGVEQVAILGAGYDSRAYRIDELNGIKVFEVDRGETQRLKRRRLSRIPHPVPSEVAFVEMDFLRQTLPEALASAGFRSSIKSFFIWEGVSHYLDSCAVDSIMRFVGRCAAKSRIAFTYIDRGLLDGSKAFSVSPNVLRLLERAGEPWKFGFDPAELPFYLSVRGLKLIEDLGAIEYGARCMGASASEMRGYEFYHVAIAEIGTVGGGSCRR